MLRWKDTSRGCRTSLDFAGHLSSLARSTSSGPCLAEAVLKLRQQWFAWGYLLSLSRPCEKLRPWAVPCGAFNSSNPMTAASNNKGFRRLRWRRRLECTANDWIMFQGCFWPPCGGSYVPHPLQHLRRFCGSCRRCALCLNCCSKLRLDIAIGSLKKVLGWLCKTHKTF